MFTRAVVSTGAPCPISRPSTVQPSFPVIHGEPSDLYGRGRVWVSVPTVATSTKNPVTGMIDTKIPWVLRGPGVLQIVGRPIDGKTGTFHGDAAAAFSHTSQEPYVLPSSLSVSRLGCWEVVGILGDARLDWVFSPRLMR